MADTDCDGEVLLLAVSEALPVREAEGEVLAEGLVDGVQEAVALVVGLIVHEVLGEADNDRDGVADTEVESEAIAKLDWRVWEACRSAEVAAGAASLLAAGRSAGPTAARTPPLPFTLRLNCYCHRLSSSLPPSST